MAAEPPTDRVKCGEIFLLASDVFSLVCKFCGDEFHIIEEFRDHITEHFTKPLPNNEEDSCSSDCMFVTSSESPKSLDKENFENPQTDDSSKSTADECGPLNYKETAKGRRRDHVAQKCQSEMETKKRISVGLAINLSDDLELVTSDENETDTNLTNDEPNHTKSIRKIPSKSRSKNKKFNLSPKIFTDKTKLENHLNTHTGQRPYAHMKSQHNTTKYLVDLSDFLTTDNKTEYGKNIEDDNPNGSPDSDCEFLSYEILNDLNEDPAETRLQNDTDDRNHHNESGCLTMVEETLLEQRESNERNVPSPERRSYNENENVTNVKRGQWRKDCRFCGKLFKHKGRLRNHENTHTGNRPYQCRICFKSFAAPTNLSAHFMLHTDDRRYKCKMCDKRYLNKTLVVRHTRETHLPDTDPRRYFPCKLCDQKFKSYNQCRTHTIKVHR